MGFHIQIVVVLCTLLLVLFVKQFLKRKKQPPGPLGLPFVGEKPLQIFQLFFPWCFPAILENQYFQNMKNKYGNIWSLDLGDKKIIVLASMDIINEAYIENSKYLIGKPTNEFFQIVGENQGIVFNDGQISYLNRQLAIKALRDMGMGKQLLETQVYEEVDELMAIIEKCSSGSVFCPVFFVNAIANISHQLVFGKRSRDNDREFKDFLKDIKLVFHSNKACDIIQFFSNILPRRYVRKLFPIVDVFLKSRDGSFGFIEKLCRDRIKVESEFSKPTCAFDFFWRYRYQDNPDIKYDVKFSDISHSMFDLFVGAIDTTTNVLSFSCLFLGQYRDVQEDIRKELQLLVDDYKLINMEMRKSCPKLLSFIDEVQRICTLIPRIPRRVLSNFTFRNYEITPDDIIFADINTAFRDPTMFENPCDFNAYRFLDKSRRTYIPNKSLIVFGAGKRVCLGEGLASMMIFLFLSKLIFKYNISLPREYKDMFKEISEGTNGLVRGPLDHEITFTLHQS